MTITATRPTKTKVLDFKIGDEVRAERSIIAAWRDLQGEIIEFTEEGQVRVHIQNGRIFTFLPDSLVKVGTHYVVQDIAGLEALPIGSQLRDRDGDLLLRLDDRTWRYLTMYGSPHEDGEHMSDRDIAIDLPFEVEVPLLDFDPFAPRDGFAIGDKVVVTVDNPNFRIDKGATGEVVQFSHSYVLVDAQGVDEFRYAFPFAPGEIAPVQSEPKFNVGDLVLVAADAKTADGGEVYFKGEKLVAKVREGRDEDGDYLVKPVIGGDWEYSQDVGEEYLTLVRAATPEPEALPTVHDQAGLDALPVGSVIRILYPETNYRHGDQRCTLRFKGTEGWLYGDGKSAPISGRPVRLYGAEVLFIND